MLRLEDAKALMRAAGGPRGFAYVVQGLLEGRDQQGREVPKVRPEDFSIRALWEATMGPVEDTLPGYMRASNKLNFIDLQEQVESTAFPTITGMLIASKVIDGYNQVGMIGDSLVTVMQSKLKSERIVGFSSLEGPLEVPEAMPYQESGLGEKWVTTETAKKGRILEITEEAIYFDQTGQLLMRAGRLGEVTRQERELVILAGVLDVGSAAVVAGNTIKDVYHPNGVATVLYSTGNTNFVSASNPLVDWRQIDAALQYAAENLKDDRPVSSERLPVMFNPKVILTARRLTGTVGRLLNSTAVWSNMGDPTAQAMAMATGNPVNTLAPGLSALSSPLIDYLANVSGSRYNDANDWFIGDPQKQFVWSEIWPLQTMRSRQDDEAAFRRDIVARFKVRYYGGISAIDNKYFIKVNG